ncbi:hypothetical protein OHA70_23420 [Kribbella sp. NBC_00382]|uniref:hypothetical protein n=1 Tax=Kribbella sp. NBC_00382 TaxID=2975967 RepID=UPI002E219594
MKGLEDDQKVCCRRGGSCGRTGLSDRASFQPAAVTAYPTGPFEVRYGNTYAVGTVTFYGRSVVARFSIRSVSKTDCRFISVVALNSRGHQMNDSAYSSSVKTCDADGTEAVAVPANVAGGASSVRVILRSYDLLTLAKKDLNSLRVFPS